MNNEIEQLAEQHGMTVEFVAWFFGEKKAACGSFWLMMMAAMWEGWKGRDGESTAALATIEKCREVSGCPAGVDLQDHLRQLAAENVAMKQAAEFATASDMWIEQADGMLDYRYHEWYVDVLKTAMETPATDRIVAEAEERGVEKAIAHLEKKFSNIGVQIMNLQWLADSLREGAK